MDLGTWIFTHFKGTQIGADAAGNRYFVERRPSPRRARVRRWVIYPAIADPSSIPAEWHAWLHYTTDAPLTGMPRHAWQRPHLANATGTAAAYRPPGHDYAGGYGQKRPVIMRAGYRPIRQSLTQRQQYLGLRRILHEFVTAAMP
jgi:NADH:ubiquinone oxidoreductase subunit